MKKDNQQHPGVRKSNAPVSPVREPATADSTHRLDATSPGGDVERVTTTTATISARYIDSRLKQFCLR
jgi:hypothetical protein